MWIETVVGLQSAVCYRATTVKLHMVSPNCPCVFWVYKTVSLTWENLTKCPGNFLLFLRNEGEKKKKKHTSHAQTHTFIFPHILPFGSVEHYASVRECCESVDFLKRGPLCFHHLKAVPSQRTARARMVPHAT